MIEIRKSIPADAAAVSALALQLWPENSFSDMEKEFSDMLNSPNAAVFLAVREQQNVGFAQCQLRHDYVEGTETSPVGYLEGIYVLEDFRCQGIARSLLQSCETWAKEMGCSEFASDCEISNEESLRFHLKAGFCEAARIICFTKRL